jgi:hypothetical protein
MKPFIALASIAVLGVALVGCDYTQSSDEIQREEQERILKESTAQTGMPAIKNFRERKLLKQMIEMRDQEGLVTYTYTVPETTGRPVFFVTLLVMVCLLPHNILILRRLLIVLMEM